MKRYIRSSAVTNIDDNKNYVKGDIGSQIIWPYGRPNDKYDLDYSLVDQVIEQIDPVINQDFDVKLIWTADYNKHSGQVLIVCEIADDEKWDVSSNLKVRCDSKYHDVELVSPKSIETQWGEIYLPRYIDLALKYGASRDGKYISSPSTRLIQIRIPVESDADLLSINSMSVGFDEISDDINMLELYIQQSFVRLNQRIEDLYTLGVRQAIEDAKDTAEHADDLDLESTAKSEDIADHDEFTQMKAQLAEDCEDFDPFYEQSESGEYFQDICYKVEEELGIWLEPSIQGGMGGIWIYSTANDETLAENIDFEEFNMDVCDLAFESTSLEDFAAKYKKFLQSYL